MKGAFSPAKGAYILPHRKKNQEAINLSKGRSPNLGYSDEIKNSDTITISNTHSEARWMECVEKGIYAHWNRPTKFKSKLEWNLAKRCGKKVSNITPYANNY